MEAIMVLIHTDFPDPVAPAISRWGMSLRSATMLFPEISFPTAKDIFDLALLNSSESISSLTRTGAGLEFSTSIPTAAFPGIGASILMLFALIFRAISSESFTMLLTLTPTAGWTSYLVTEAPWVTLITWASTLKFLKVVSSWSALAWRSDSEADTPEFTGFFSRSTGGRTYPAYFPCPAAISFSISFLSASVAGSAFVLSTGETAAAAAGIWAGSGSGSGTEGDGAAGTSGALCWSGSRPVSFAFVSAFFKPPRPSPELTPAFSSLSELELELPSRPVFFSFTEPAMEEITPPRPWPAAGPWPWTSPFFPVLEVRPSPSFTVLSSFMYSRIFFLLFSSFNSSER